MTLPKIADDLLWSAKAIAEYTGLHVRSVYNYAEDGELPTFKVGGILCARRSELEAHFSAYRGGAK